MRLLALPLARTDLERYNVLVRLPRVQLRPYQAGGLRSGTPAGADPGCLVPAEYLPTLNADIIDNGVLNGDTGYIVRTGGVMIVITLDGVDIATMAGDELRGLTGMVLQDAWLRSARSRRISATVPPARPATR